MKKHFFRRIAVGSVLALAFIVVPTAEARLPKPIKLDGVVLAIDHETNTLVFKVGKGKKPLVLDWDKDSEFLKSGQATTPDGLKAGATVTIYYKLVSFRNPLLKKIVWQE